MSITWTPLAGFTGYNILESGVDIDASVFTELIKTVDLVDKYILGLLDKSRKDEIQFAINRLDYDVYAVKATMDNLFSRLETSECNDFKQKELL